MKHRPDPNFHPQDESVAAARIPALIGRNLEAPCEECGKDWYHTSDCPIAIKQKQLAAEYKAQREAHERAHRGGKRMPFKGKGRVA